MLVVWLSFHALLIHKPQISIQCKRWYVFLSDILRDSMTRCLHSEQCVQSANIRREPLVLHSSQIYPV